MELSRPPLVVAFELSPNIACAGESVGNDYISPSSMRWKRLGIEYAFAPNYSYWQWPHASSPCRLHSLQLSAPLQPARLPTTA